METLATVFNILISVLTLYMILVSLRVLLTWFGGLSIGKVGAYLGRITDPYLNFFRRFKIFQTRTGIDFSPIAALLVLNLVVAALSLLKYGASPGQLISLPFELIWSTLAFFIGLVFFVALVRFVTLLTGWGGMHPVFQMIDRLIQPLVVKISRILSKRLVTYTTGLVFLMALALVAYLLGSGLLVLLRLLLGTLLG